MVPLSDEQPKNETHCDVRVAVFEFRPLRARHSSLPNTAEEVQEHEHFRNVPQGSQGLDGAGRF